MHGTEEASKGGRLRVRINHGLNISHKELTYLLQKSTSHQKPSTTCMLLGGRLVGVNHRAPPTSTQGKAIKRASHAINLSHNFYYTCILRELPTSTQAFFKFTITSTSMTLISLPPYLRTIIKYQIDHSIQFTFCDSFYYTQLGCPSF